MRIGEVFTERVAVDCRFYARSQGRMPVPSRDARDGTAATKPSCLVVGGFCRGRPFLGGQPFLSSRIKLNQYLAGVLIALPAASTYNCQFRCTSLKVLRRGPRGCQRRHCCRTV